MNKLSTYLATLFVLVVFIFVKTKVHFINSVRYDSNLICIIQDECSEKFMYAPQAAVQLGELDQYLPVRSNQNEAVFSNFSIVADILKEYTNSYYISRLDESILISFYFKGDYISLKVKQHEDYFELEEIQNFEYLTALIQCIQNEDNL